MISICKSNTIWILNHYPNTQIIKNLQAANHQKHNDAFCSSELSRSKISGIGDSPGHHFTINSPLLLISPAEMSNMFLWQEKAGFLLCFTYWDLVFLKKWLFRLEHQKLTWRVAECGSPTPGSGASGWSARGTWLVAWTAGDFGGSEASTSGEGSWQISLKKKHKNHSKPSVENPLRNVIDLNENPLEKSMVGFQIVPPVSQQALQEPRPQVWPRINGRQKKTNTSPDFLREAIIEIYWNHWVNSLSDIMLIPLIRKISHMLHLVRLKHVKTLRKWNGKLPVFFPVINSTWNPWTVRAEASTRRSFRTSESVSWTNVNQIGT